MDSSQSHTGLASEIEQIRDACRVIASGRRLVLAAVPLGSLGQMRAQVSHSVVVERLSLSRGGSLFKSGTLQG